MTLDQISNYKINAVNQFVYAAKERAQQEGYFTDEIKNDLNNNLLSIGFSSGEIETQFDSFEIAQQMGTILNYRVAVQIDKPMVGLMVSDNAYEYVIDSCTVSQYVVLP